MILLSLNPSQYEYFALSSDSKASVRSSVFMGKLGIW